MSVQSVLSGKDWVELCHALIKCAVEIGREHAGKPFAKLACFAAVAVALEPVQINETACVHVFNCR